MSKEINITHIDTQDTKEKIGEEKKHVELEHEKLFREYNIDPKRVHNNDTTVPIPRDWIPEIIETCIERTEREIDVYTIHNQINKKNHLFTLAFKTTDDVKAFDEGFSKTIFKSINDFIESKGKNVKKYHRNIIFTKKIEELKLTLEY